MIEKQRNLCYHKSRRMLSAGFIFDQYLALSLFADKHLLLLLFQHFSFHG